MKKQIMIKYLLRIVEDFFIPRCPVGAKYDVKNDLFER